MSAPTLFAPIHACPVIMSAPENVPVKKSLFSKLLFTFNSATFKSLKALATLTSFFRSGGSKIVSTTIVLTCGRIEPSA